MFSESWSTRRDPLKKPKVSPWLIAGAAAAAGTAVFYYLKAGAGSGKNADFIPDAVEAKLDSVIEALNKKFGSAWVERGLSLLEGVLAKALPTPLVSLVDVVYRTEQWAKEEHAKTGRKVPGKEKLSYAAKLSTT